MRLLFLLQERIFYDAQKEVSVKIKTTVIQATVSLCKRRNYEKTTELFSA
jgi:hypothetical protein